MAWTPILAEPAILNLQGTIIYNCHHSATNTDLVWSAMASSIVVLWKSVRNYNSISGQILRLTQAKKKEKYIDFGTPKEAGMWCASSLAAKEKEDCSFWLIFWL